MDEIVKSIYEYPYKKIELDELKKIIKLNEYADLVEAINSLISRGVVKPVKKSGKNGLNPSLFLKYHIINNFTTDKMLIDELNSLHYLINADVFRKTSRNISKIVILFSR